MRDIAVALALAALVPLSAMHPWIGAMSWVWVSVMNPHRLTYGFMYDAPVAMLIAVATLIGLVFSRDPKRLPFAAPLVWLGLFGAWMVITYPFSLDPGPENAAQLSKVLKIVMMTFVVVAVIHTRKQVDILIAVIAFSIAFYGIKGGIFSLMTGGAFQVRGPEGSFIAGNNEVALGLVMSVPLLYYLLLRSVRPGVRAALWIALLLTVLAALTSYSRGALLAIAAMTVAFVWRSPKRGKLILPIVGMALFVFAFMPEQWWNRMGTVATYDEDASALGRINAWMMAWNVATSHFFGGGFSLETAEIFGKFAPDPSFIAVAHSIYFQILGQHGFVGLALFLGMALSMLKTTRWLSRNSDSVADHHLARMVEISMVGYAAGGAFLNLAYFDGPYYLLAAVVVLRYKLLNNAALARGGKVRPDVSADVRQERTTVDTV